MAREHLIVDVRRTRQTREPFTPSEEAEADQRAAEGEEAAAADAARQPDRDRIAALRERARSRAITPAERTEAIDIALRLGRL